MPGLNGYQVLAYLKADRSSGTSPSSSSLAGPGWQTSWRGCAPERHDYLKNPSNPKNSWPGWGSALHVKQLQDQLRDRNALLDQLSRTDVLTDLSNRRHLDEELARRVGEARRYQDPLGLVLLDIDHFKRVNDFTDTLLPTTSCAGRPPDQGRVTPTGHRGTLGWQGVPRHPAENRPRRGDRIGE